MMKLVIDGWAPRVGHPPSRCTLPKDGNQNQAQLAEFPELTIRPTFPVFAMC